MLRLLPALCAPVLFAGSCEPIENELIPAWPISPLQRLGCDGTADAAASAEDRPVAVCSADALEVAPIYGYIGVDGLESTTPEGTSIIDYSWRVVSTPDGVGRIPVTASPQQAFTPLVAGEYTLELVVTNDECVMSDPCQVTVNARPEQDLWVELTWEHPGDDMDLHLLYPGAQPESEGDCYFGNCVDMGLNWGTPATTLDDPILDLDDVPGTGPENINLYEPEPVTYTVMVHDYPGSTLTRDNDVRVKIYLDGTLAFDETKTISGEDTYTTFAEVNVPLGVVTPR